MAFSPNSLASHSSLWYDLSTFDADESIASSSTSFRSPLSTSHWNCKHTTRRARAVGVRVRGTAMEGEESGERD